MGVWKLPSPEPGGPAPTQLCCCWLLQPPPAQGSVDSPDTDLGLGWASSLLARQKSLLSSKATGAVEQHLWHAG